MICDLEIETVKKDIKNIHVGVYPPNGRVRVAAPLKTTDEAIKLLVISKMPWIKKQQTKVQPARAPNQTRIRFWRKPLLFGQQIPLKRYSNRLLNQESK